MNNGSNEKRDPRQSAHVEAADKYVAAVERAQQVFTAVTDDSMDVEQFRQLAESLTLEMIEAKRAFLEARDSNDEHASR